MVIGPPGSGKSTLSRAIGSELGLPVHHLDHLFHLPGWGERPKSEVDAMLAAWVAGEAWVIDGNRSTRWAERAARADLILYLERPVALRLWRVVLRVLRHRGEVRPDMAPGCPERFDRDFIAYILTTRRSYRRKARALVAAHPGKAKRIGSDAEAQALLRRLKGRRIPAA